MFYQSLDYKMFTVQFYNYQIGSKNLFTISLENKCIIYMCSDRLGIFLQTCIYHYCVYTSCYKKIQDNLLNKLNFVYKINQLINESEEDVAFSSYVSHCYQLSSKILFSVLVLNVVRESKETVLKFLKLCSQCTQHLNSKCTGGACLLNEIFIKTLSQPFFFFMKFLFFSFFQCIWCV